MELNYHKEFLKSPEHLWTAVGTIGGGLAVGNPGDDPHTAGLKFFDADARPRGLIF